MKKTMIITAAALTICLALTGCKTLSDTVAPATATASSSPAVITTATVTPNAPASSTPAVSPNAAADSTDAPVSVAPSTNPVSASSPTDAKEFYSPTPQTVLDSISISPNHVYYKDGELHMDAFVYNGYDTTAYDIHNIKLTLSDHAGLIAKGNFDEMSGASIASQTYIVWTFIFAKDSVVNTKSDLSYLNCHYECDNSN